MSIEGQGHFFTIYFSGFICFVLYLCRPRYQVSVYRTIGPLVYLYFIIVKYNCYAPNFEKVGGGHIGFGLSVCMYVRTYVFMFEISS